MYQVTLSEHFKKNWRRRVGGGDPDPADVRRILKESIKVQPCRQLCRVDGRPFRQLAIYWHPERCLIIKIDSISRVAVSLLTESAVEAGSVWRMSA